MSLHLLTTLPNKMIEMQTICSGVDGIKVQLWEAITRYRTRISENGLRGRIEFGLLLWKPFVSKRWHPSIKGSMPPSIGHMELLVWIQRADFSEHIQGFRSPGDPLNSSHFDAPNTKSAPTGYRRAPNIISHHYKQQLSAKASIVPKAWPIRFR